MVVAISPQTLANAQTVRMNGSENGETIQIITAATDAQGNLVTGGKTGQDNSPYFFLVFYPCLDYEKVLLLVRVNGE